MALTEIGARLRLAGAPAFTRDADKGADGLARLAREAGQADRKVSGLERAAARSRSALGGIAKGAAFGAIGVAAAGIGALSVGLIQGFKDAASMQTMLAKTNAVVKSTGGVAKVSADSVLKMSDQLEALSMIDQEAILNGQNLLLTFTNVRNGVGEANHIFDQATRAMVDMSAAMGSDPQTAAIQLGKALNDPVKGVAALSKVGVSFTKQQKDQIKTLVESGKTMDAQKVILRELNVQFGGAAKAAGSGFEGALFRAKDALGDLFRDVATPLLPGFTKKIEDLSGYLSNTATPAILDFVRGFQDGSGAGGEFRSDLLELKTAAEDVGEGLQFGYEKTKQVVDFVRNHGDSFGPIAAGVLAYRTAMKSAAIWSATMGTNGVLAAGGMTAAGNSAKINTGKVAGFATALGRAAGAAGVLAGLYFTNDTVKGTLDEIGGGIKKVGSGDIGGGLKDIVLGELPFKKDKPKAAAPSKPRPGGSAEDRIVRPKPVNDVLTPSIADRRGKLATVGAGAQTPAAATGGGPRVVRMEINGRVLGEALIDDGEDRVARR